MEGVRQYVLSVAAAAMVVGIVTGVCGEKNMGGMILKLMGGLFLLFTVTGPAARIGSLELGGFIAEFSVNGENAASQGENMAREAYCSYIKTETEAYILDKADAIGAALSVEVSLKENGVPDSVQIRGTASADARKYLQNVMAEDLGISKEHQEWIG